MKILIYILVAIGCYLFGSISPSIIISNSIEKKDIRQFGSGNAGSTNMVRTFGWKLGLLTFSLDVIKGAAVALLCQFLAETLADTQGIVIMVGCIAAILGHSFPIYYKFRGGKGIASTLGIFLVLMTTPTLGALGISLLVIIISGMVSAGSIIGVIICSIFSFLFDNEISTSVTIVSLAVITIFLHRENIARILKGTERKLSLSKKH